jgi:acyl-CoA synthetase (AMP-forming)/AMP-acid ligase II
VAKRLLAIGCQRGDVIATFSPNSITYVVVQLAAMRIGAVPAGINCQLKVGELKQQLQTCGAKFIFTTEQLAAVALDAADESTVKVVFLAGSIYPGCVDIEAVADNDVDKQLLTVSLPTFESLDIKPDDPYVIYFSSGTTGPQKGVVFSTRGSVHCYLLARHPKCRLATTPVHVAFTPLAHALSLLTVHFPLIAGCSVHLLTRFNIDDFMQTIDEKQVEFAVVVPPVVTMLLRCPASQKYRLSSLRDLLVSAAPLNAEIEEEFMKKYTTTNVRQAYGMTESSAFVLFTPYEEDITKFIRKPGTAGLPVPTVQMKVICPTSGEALGPREQGEVYIKSPCLMLGYINNPEATSATIDKDGWLHTGDIGYYDEDGYFFIVDRLKELIKYNAYQVAPSELEAIILTHPQVMDAAVVGLPDPSAGELPLAFVVRKPGATVTESELQQFVEEKVAPFKKLRGGVRFVSAIPRTASGKILRRELKAAIVCGKGL